MPFNSSPRSPDMLGETLNSRGLDLRKIIKLQQREDRSHFYLILDQRERESDGDR